jgi:hypothetical protein
MSPQTHLLVAPVTPSYARPAAASRDVVPARGRAALPRLRDAIVRLLLMLRWGAGPTPAAATPDGVALVVPDETDRGDVPGWVLITVMTAGLVTGLWLVAEPQLEAFFRSALDAVHGP